MVDELAGIAKEEDYLEATDQYLPFSTSLRAEQYIKLKRLEYWSRRSIRELVETIFEAAFDKLPQTKKKLPPQARTRLKPLKSANDYY